MITFRDRYKGTISNAPSTGGDLIIHNAYPAYQRFEATDDNLLFDVVIMDVNNQWEIRKGCQYHHATNLLTRGTLVDSSNGSPIALTENALWAVTLIAERTIATTLTNSAQDESIYYNAGTNTYTNQIAFSKLIKQYVKNGNGTTISKGEVVYVSDAVGTNILISKAKADTDLTSATTIGFAAQDFAINGFGYIITEGILTGVNTTAATDEGDPIWLSPTVAGGVLYGMANKPHAPDHMVYLGVVTRINSNNGEIFIKCQNGYEISELHDVLITTPIQDDLLVYNGTTNIWENKNTLNQLAITNTTETLTKTSTIDGWTYSGKSISVSAQETASRGLSFSTDGTKMYIVGQTNDTVYQYTLSTPFDVSTATYASKSFSVLAQDTASTSIFFKTDGLAFYMLGDTVDTVFQYTLSTAWDISTAAYASKSFSVTAQETAPSGLEISPDGTKMYVIGTTNDTVYQYTLSTAWDVSTATYATKSFSVTLFEGSPTGIEFNSDGTKMYVVGSGYDCIIEYTLSTAWDVSTSVFTDKLLVSNGISVINPLGLSIASAPHDIYTDFSNNVAYIFDLNTQRVFQYTTNTTPLKVSGNKLVVSPFTYFKNDIATLGSIRALGSFAVDNAAILGSTVNVGSTLTASGSLVASSTITLNGATTSATTIGTAATTGTTTIGGTAQTGTITLGQSTATHTLNIDAGATISGATKTVAIGTGGVSGSTTNISIGSNVSGATNNITINGSTAIVSATSRVGIGTDSGGSISLGRLDNTASSPHLDFNSGATTVDYDTRIMATSGNGTAGNGTLSIYTGTLGIGTIGSIAGAVHIRRDVNGVTNTIIQNRNGTGTPLSALTFITGLVDYSDNRYAQIVSGGSSSNYLAFLTSNGAAPTEKLRIDASGNVLIGSTTNVNSSKLLVNGTIETTTGVRFPDGVTQAVGIPSVSGQNGKYLTTNGSTVSWAAGVGGLIGYTVATLPGGTAGMTAYVTDAVAPTYLGALTGGGTVKCPVFYNGTAWVSH